MNVELFEHQRAALDKLRTGSILCGGVGSGKSITAIAYYFYKACKAVNNKMTEPKDLYIITTARKRDTGEWVQECERFDLMTDYISTVKVTIDSWNNVSKYKNVTGAVFLFDEQRAIGSGAWANTFIHIAKSNDWILLSATPGDCWMDYIPVFVANGFYKNRTEFIRRHVIYKQFSKFRQVDRYVETKRLMRLKNQILVDMPFRRDTVQHHEVLVAQYNADLYRTIMKDRWDPFKEEPIQDVSNLCYLLRHVVNSDPSRLDLVKAIIEEHP